AYAELTTQGGLILGDFKAVLPAADNPLNTIDAEAKVVESDKVMHQEFRMGMGVPKSDNPPPFSKMTFDAKWNTGSGTWDGTASLTVEGGELSDLGTPMPMRNSWCITLSL